MTGGMVAGAGFEPATSWLWARRAYCDQTVPKIYQKYRNIYKSIQIYRKLNIL